YAGSKADIVGLKTGMTFGQFTQKLPDKFKNISPSKGDIEVTLYGKNRGTQATIHFLIEQRFVKTRDLFGNILRQN
ncbi:MAG: hypothetical protein COC24_018995, partial [Alphaproteobacteria bacterium]|nr:hypothetical protein [Alphaproteobacteria bacterium]